MYPVNLYLLTKTKPLNNGEFNDYFECVSKSRRNSYIRDVEREDLRDLVELFKNNRLELDYLSGFYYSYTIEQIGKEFDLLKLYKDFVLNIEIKSELVDVEKIKKQLKLNVYYLKSVNMNVYAFTYVSKENIFYRLNENNELEETSIDSLIEIIKSSKEYVSENLDKIFKPANYLVSPFNDVEKFIGNEYFLTNHQRQIKKDIIESIRKNINKLFEIVGYAGTGKTLLIYDIAKELAKNTKVCIIHSGLLSDGHLKLREMLENVEIISANEFNNFDITKFDVIIVDEAQRFNKKDFKRLVEMSTKGGCCVIFSLGNDQIMQETEIKDNIEEALNKIGNVQKFELTKKIRTNKNMASFIQNIFNLDRVNRKANYEDFDIYYVFTKTEARELIEYLKELDYQYIAFTPSQNANCDMNEFSNFVNTHTAIGVEFDNVVMIMGENWKYVDNKLCSKPHSNLNLLFDKLFYQGVTRARLKLTLVVYRNLELYKTLVKIKENRDYE